MATRTDITVTWMTSPRVVTVAAPSDEFLQQDVVDTLRVLESSLRGMSEPSLLNAFGKQPLFGTVSVGITTVLQNAVIEFEPRVLSAQAGTATTATGPQQLIDSAADFVAAGVKRGSFVINHTDLSVSGILNVVSSTELELRGLSGGAENDFDFGDVYDVWNIDLVTALGGNLTAVDDAQVEIDPLIPTFGTQVNRALSADATIVDDSRIADIHKVHGLDSTAPLLVTDTTRTAGGVTQTISDDGTTTTVTRT